MCLQCLWVINGTYDIGLIPCSWRKMAGSCHRWPEARRTRTWTKNSKMINWRASMMSFDSSLPRKSDSDTSEREATFRRLNFFSFQALHNICHLFLSFTFVRLRRTGKLPKLLRNNGVGTRPSVTVSFEEGEKMMEFSDRKRKVNSKNHSFWGGWEKPFFACQSEPTTFLASKFVGLFYPSSFLVGFNHAGDIQFVIE